MLKWSFAMVAFLRGTAAYVPQTVDQIAVGVRPSKSYGQITKEMVVEVVNGDPGRFTWVKDEAGHATSVVKVSRPRREARIQRDRHGVHHSRPSTQ